MKKTNMRAGFTMIELIFVIVIIGILAAIAMNKLSATRDDAKISQIIANAKTFVNDAKAYYTAQGLDRWKNATISDVTDVPLYTSCSSSGNTQANTNATLDGNTSFYFCANGESVVKIDANDTHITISDGNGTGAVASAVKSNPTFKALKKSTRLGGTGVNFNN